jgi:hypothetical protein
LDVSYKYLMIIKPTTFSQFYVVGTQLSQLNVNLIFIFSKFLDGIETQPSPSLDLNNFNLFNESGKR